MLLSFKSPWARLAFLAGGALTLSAVFASPLDVVDSESSSALLLARAGTKYVGTKCATNEECYSGNCELLTGINAKTCQRQTRLGECVENNNCVSRLCSNGRCQGSPINGPCLAARDCDDPFNRVCVANKCAVRTTAAAPNTPCAGDSDCLSGSCVPRKSCFDPSGTEGQCFFNEPRVCNRLPLGSACVVNGDCLEGYCRSGVCAASRTGDVCVSEFQCTGAAVCAPTGKCHTPASRTLYPSDVCATDAQCYSGSCVPNLRPYYDLIQDTNSGPTSPTTKCNYLRLGQGTCRKFEDCFQGLCKSGKCALGATGDRCFFNVHCAGVCGNNGLCAPTPANRTLAIGQACKTNEQCQTGTCVADYYARPVPSNPSTTSYVKDTVCVKATAGGYCPNGDSDCVDSACRQGVCTALGVGDTCTSLSQCSTFNCTQGKCALAGSHVYCRDGSSCYSGVCEAVPDDPYYQRSWCQTVPTGGTCRADLDCDVFTSQCSLADSKCRLLANYACTGNGDCFNGVCKSDGRCN